MRYCSVKLVGGVPHRLAHEQLLVKLLLTALADAE